MDKMTKHILFIMLASFSLLLSSCSNFIGKEDSTAEVKPGKDPVYINIEEGYVYLKLSIEDVSAKMTSRTIVPKFESDYSHFEKFELTGKLNGEDSNSITRTFTASTEPEKTAYENFQAAVIPLPLLTSAKENWTFTLKAYYAGTTDDSATIFTAQKEVELAGGLQTINFELKRNSAYDFTSEVTGKIAYSLSFAGSTVQKVRVTVKKGETEQTKTFNVSSTASVSFDNLAPGKYTVDMTFLAADDVVVGKRQEIAYVIQGLTSELENNTAPIDVDATHTITYNNGNASFAGFSASPVSSFSRHNAVTLPVTSDFTEEFNSTWTFLGWYESAEFEGEPVSSIPKNTRVEDLTLYGKFVHLSEKPTLTDFAFTYSDSLKVGHTVTATPKAGESDFLGTITSWKWYYSSGSSWTEITGSDAAISVDSNPATDSTPAKSTLTIKPAYADKKLKVVAVQKYRITESSVSGVFDIADNTASVSKETATVAKGQLAAGTIALSYNDIIVRNTALQNSFEISDGYLSDAKATGWTYDSNKVSISYNTESGKMAPASSNTVSGIPISFTVSGYETFTPGTSVFIKVKYAAPTMTSEEPAVVPSLHENEYEVTYGHLKFDTASDKVQYKVDSGDWANITTSEFPSGSLLVRYAENSSQGAEGQEEYIYPSDSFTLSTAGYVGKKVLLNSVKFEDDSDFKVTGTIRAEALPVYNGTGINFVEEGYGTLVWSWYAVDGENESLIWRDTNTHSTRSSIVITEARRLQCYDKKIRVKAAYTYNKQDIAVINKDATSSSVGKGNLDVSDVNLTYSEVEEQGASLSTSKLSISGLKNSNNEAVTAVTSNLSFENPTAPQQTGDVNVKINITGYNEAQKAVRITVQRAAPSAAALSGLLSENQDIIQFGHIRFAAESSSLEWAYISRDSGTYGDWHDIDTSKSYPKVDEDGTNNFFEGAAIAVRYKATSGTVPSKYSSLNITTQNIGVRSGSIEITVHSESQIGLTINGYNISATSGIHYGKTCRWFIDDVEQSETGTFLALDTSNWIRGSYSIRVESENSHGEAISATATLVYNGN